MPTNALETVLKAGLNVRKPFASLPSKAPETWLKVNILRLTERLVKAEKIRTSYSAHDLRHYFADRHKERGLLWLQERLGHTSLTITERYLKNKFCFTAASL